MKKPNRSDRLLDYLPRFQFAVGCLTSGITLCLAGCDPIYGVGYEVAVARVPSPDAASSALRSVEGLKTRSGELDCFLMMYMPRLGGKTRVRSRYLSTELLKTRL